MAYAYWKSGKKKDHAVFDLFFRQNPFQGEFTIFAGLEECLKFLENFQYSDSGKYNVQTSFGIFLLTFNLFVFSFSKDMAYLKETLPSSIEPEFFVYLKNLTAKDVTVYAIEEGSVVFPRFVS